MPIADTDILIKFSVKTGSAGDSTAGTAAGSLGKYISTTAITDNTLNNLFDDVSGPENAASDVEYRCIFVQNNHGSLTYKNVVVYIASQVANGATINIGLDPAGITDADESDPQAAEIATESDAPAGVTFSNPTSYGTGLSIGDIIAGSVAAVWIRRTAANNAALDNDGATLTFSGETNA